MRYTTVITAALLCALTACGSSSDDGKPTVTKASDTPSPTPTPSPSEEQLEFKLGDTANITTAEGAFTAAALSYRDTGIHSSVPDLLESGQKWAIVEAKYCNKGKETVTVSPFPWSLAYEDGARVEATHLSGADLPPPLYPMDAKVKAGDCVRGNITFQVPTDGRPDRVFYSPEVLDEPVEWQVTKG
jgi:hypothetical protein